MSCRRICRELVELFRFGELDRRSAPHLEHLATCRSCRDEVGFDRELVDRLRVALAERVAHEGPSGSAWPTILARAQADEPSRWLRWLRWSPGVLAERLRAASGIAVVGLAAVLSAGTQIDIVQTSNAPLPNRHSPGDAFEAAVLLPGPRPAIAIDADEGRVVVPYVPPDPESEYIFQRPQTVASVETSTEGDDGDDSQTHIVVGPTSSELIDAQDAKASTGGIPHRWVAPPSAADRS